MFYQIFLSPQVKRCTIITYKYGIYELPDELPNDLRLRIFGNWKISGLPAKVKFLEILAEKSRKTETKLFALCTISHENYS